MQTPPDSADPQLGAPDSADPQLGARFFDRNRRDLGWAFRVSRRVPLLGGLTLLDVSTTETELAASLLALDNDPLFVESGDPTGQRYAFAWASGYANGNQIRVQGMLA
jgi:hypothetical protein